MSDTEDPTARLTAAFTQAADAWMKSAQAFWTAAADTTAAAAADPVAVGGAVQSLFADFIGATFAHLPDDVATRLRAQGFGQVDRRPGVRTTPPSQATPSDPQRLQQLWDALMAEYQGDLGALPESAFAVDLTPLSQAFAATTTGTADPRQAAMVSDFLGALSVKARLGPEYYADPATTAVRPTPRELVTTVGPIELYRYQRSTPSTRGAPVLIVYSVINRSYILDLSDDCSFVSHLLERGHDVFMVEWGGSTPGDHDRTLDWTLTEGLHGCVEAITEATGSQTVSLFGHCIGGTFGAMYAALHPERVERLVCLTAPFRPAEAGVVAWLTDPANFPVDAVVDGFGHMPAKLIRYTFIGLKPYYELTKWRTFVKNLGEPEAMSRFRSIDKWANDNVDVPPEVFRAFVAETLQSERLVSGETTLDGRAVDLAAIEAPVYSLYGDGDWIVRPEAALALHSVRGERPDDRTEQLPGGHLGFVLDDRLRDRWDSVSDFLASDA